MADANSPNPQAPPPAARNAPPNQPPPNPAAVRPDKRESAKTAWVGLALTALMIGGAWLAPGPWNWLIVLAAMAAFMAMLGVFISGNPLGILINHRNLISLSRFQMVLWTLLILSAYFTLALVRVKVWLTHAGQVPDPLAVGIDPHLWALMGISTTSLVGCSLLAGVKKVKEPDPAAVPKAALTLGENAGDLEKNREGILYGNPQVSDARVTDMFQGDEVADTAHIDLPKVQMFFFTLLVVAGYGVAIFNLMARPDAALAGELPKLSDGVIALLGISHAGYLTKKGISQTKTQ